MYDTKGFLASKTVWGGAIALAAGVAGIFGYTITPADQVGLVEGVSSIAAVVGGLVAIYGRVTATKRLGR